MCPRRSCGRTSQDERAKQSAEVRASNRAVSVSPLAIPTQPRREVTFRRARWCRSAEGRQGASNIRLRRRTVKFTVCAASAHAIALLLLDLAPGEPGAPPPAVQAGVDRPRLDNRFGVHDPLTGFATRRVMQD